MIDDTIANSLITQAIYWTSLLAVVGGVAYLVVQKDYRTALLVSLLSAMVHGVYWNSLIVAAEKWESPEYSHGYLVPLFAIILLWVRWQPLREPSTGAQWTGVGLIALGFSLRLFSAWYNFVIPDMVSIMPCLFGIFLLVGGWGTMRSAGPALAFLVFMFPWPDVLEHNLLQRLKQLSTLAATYTLQTIGMPAYSDGNRIMLGDVQLGIVDQCAGLRMATVLLALGAAIALFMERPLWERALVVFSAIPIAMIANVVRIVVTGVMHALGQAELANSFHEDYAVFVMVPLALGLLFVETEILSHLFVEDKLMVPITRGSTVPGAHQPRGA